MFHRSSNTARTHAHTSISTLKSLVNFCSSDFLFNEIFDDSTLAKRHNVVGHYVRSDTGHVMQAIDVTKHSRLTQQLVPSTTLLFFVCFSRFARKKIAHDFRYNTRMLVLQSCTDCLHIVPGTSGESHATSSDGVCNFSNIEVDEDPDVKEEGFIAVNEEVDIGIKQEEIPEDIDFPEVKSAPDEVDYVCVCLLLDTIYQCPAMSVVFWPLESARIL